MLNLASLDFAKKCASRATSTSKTTSADDGGDEEEFWHRDKETKEGGSPCFVDDDKKPPPRVSDMSTDDAVKPRAASEDDIITVAMGNVSGPPPRLSPRRIMPGAVSVDGPGLDMPQQLEEQLTEIAMADAVDNAELVVYASSVNPDERVKMRRRIAALGTFSCLLIFALVFGLSWAGTRTSVDNQGDPRCLLPREHQDIFAHCACHNTTEGLHLTSKEREVYYTSQRLMLDHNFTTEIPARDSCSFENQCLLSGANYMRRGTDEEIVNVTLGHLSYSLQFYTLCLLYLNFDGPNWDRNDDWVVSDQVCDYFGVRCNFLHRVEALDLSSNGLDGTLPSEIRHMPFLRKFLRLEIMLL